MTQLTVFDQTNKEVGNITLDADVFGVEVKPEILNLVVRATMAAKRAGTHSTKTRAFVSGGGRKPWRQKGTGRARAGTIRSPLWRGGAVIFGPQPRDYDFKVNKKVRRLAMRMALSSRLAEEKLTVVKGIELPEVKTKKFVEVAEALGLKKALIVVDKVDNNLSLSARNMPFITVVSHDKLSVREILRHPQLVISEAAVEEIQKRLK